MWDCKHCGCRAIAAGLESCPMCRTPRKASADSPPAGEATSAEKVAESGASNPGSVEGPSLQTSSVSVAAAEVAKEKW